MCNLKTIGVPALILAVFLLPACTPLAPTGGPKPEPTSRANGPQPGAAPSEAEITQLLHEAEMAFEDARLTTPVDDNAYLRYLRVLSLDPENEAAAQGITAIVEKYLSWALEHAEAGNLRLATRYLRNAASIDDDHPGIESIGKRVSELKVASRDTHRLPVAPLDGRSPEIARKLHRLARLATERDALVVISARTDAEGRWIYQQMNGATPGRIRARLELSSRPRIRMVYKDPDG
ncbi:MAG: hypothetical protein U5O39_08710 [Gammaproteobacteria bacterium]|nr:hypothetical protein [Gammaproteobacteria bacterium]